MKVLVADKFEDSGRRGLTEIGCDVVYEPDLSGESLAQTIAKTQAEVLVVRSTEVSRAALEAGRLSLVVRAGAGYNTIDVEAASERGIWVANCPGKNAIAVAELTMGLILAQDRRIVDGTNDLRAGKWNKKEYSKAKGLFGRTLGIFGIGAIGREVVLRAHAFGMRVIAWGPSVEPHRAHLLAIEQVATVNEVARVSDVISVHLALNSATRGLLGESFFSEMRPGATFVNASRAEVVDNAALERALRESRIRCGLDVFAGEPETGTGSVNAPIFQLPNAIGTHHIGASTEQAQEAMAEETVRIVRVYKESGRAPNVVNLAKKSPATHMLVVRHLDRVGVLAAIFDCLKGGGINVQETENIVFEGAKAAVARIHLSSSPSGETMEALRKSTPDIIEATLVAL